ncbi:unnamed protein product [Notodromas monacha]|uniref:glutaminase n=1 Tax=Notodromas monacha TaxID=399045 RepID=A0A7R9BLQ6_9CRUS|nr:unnamed protein product [Notodromas monacha]CAG0917803.1 unnamed protein product [Notodromas monacha]
MEKKIGKKVFMHDKKLGRFLERRASNQSLGGEGKVIVNFEETVYNIFNNEGKVAVRVLIKALDEQGIKLDDPRLREFTDYLSQVAMEKSFESEDGEPVLIENLTLEKSTFISYALLHTAILKRNYDEENESYFHSLVKQNRMMLSKALRSKFVLPEFRKFCAIVKQFFLECKSMELGGQPYPLIRQTASINPDAFGISICSTDGQRFSIGDAKDPFLLLSCSNVLTYSLARTHLSSDEVHEYVGQEPSGRNCSELAVDSNNRPWHSIFLWNRPVLCMRQKACGGLPLTFNNSAYIGLRHRADGNYAQAFYMRETKSFPSTVNLESCMELYLQCRAMEGTCEALAVVAATLANGGINPITGETKIVTAFPFHHFDNAKHDKMKSDPCMAEVYEKSEAVVAILFSAASGDVTAMRRFFMSGMNLNTADYDGRTPLHLSAAEGHTECVEFLVKTCKVDPNSRDRYFVDRFISESQHNHVKSDISV